MGDLLHMPLELSQVQKTRYAQIEKELNLTQMASMREVTSSAQMLYSFALLDILHNVMNNNVFPHYI